MSPDQITAGQGSRKETIRADGGPVIPNSVGDEVSPMSALTNAFSAQSSYSVTTGAMYVKVEMAGVAANAIALPGPTLSSISTFTEPLPKC